MSKVKIDDRYLPQEEIRRDDTPYIAYFKCLITTFDMYTTNGFCDVGCSTGGLLKHIKTVYPTQEVLGIEYFAWQREAADLIIQKYITIHDIRDPMNDIGQYDIVNCSEVGEHIDPEYCPTLLKNLHSICRKHLIMTWSMHGGAADRAHDPHHQHLNPLSYDEYVSTVEKYGFFKNDLLTIKFRTEAACQPGFKSWWLESLVVFDCVEKSQ